MNKEYSEEEGKKLLELARKSIKESFENKETKKLLGNNYEKLRGVFVTLHTKIDSTCQLYS